MLRFVILIAFFLTGVTLLLDSILPMRTEQLHVGRHMTQVHSEYHSTGSYKGTRSSIKYKIYLFGGSISSCAIGISEYKRIEDGDAVEVQSTRLFKRCVRIYQGAELIHSEQYWKMLAFIVGCLFIVVAFRLLKNGDSSGSSLTI